MACHAVLLTDHPRTTLQEVKHTTEQIQSTTNNIYRDTGDIKDDTARILQAITELQARLPPDENPRFNMLQRYLDELSTYAESVIDDIDHHPVPEEFLHEDTTTWGVGMDISSTTFVDNIQAVRHNEIPSLDRLYIHDLIQEDHSSHLHSPPGNEGSPSRGPNRQGGDDFDNEKIARTIMREKGSRQKRVRVLTSDPATHAEDNPPTVSEYQATDTHQLRDTEPVKPTLEDFEGPFAAQSASISDPSGSTRAGTKKENDEGSYCVEARNLERIIGLPNHFIPHDESTTIRPCDSVKPWCAFFVPKALLACALLIPDTIILLGAFSHPLLV